MPIQSHITLDPRNYIWQLHVVKFKVNLPGNLYGRFWRPVNMCLLTIVILTGKMIITIVMAIKLRQ
jgi:hypothetical protein